MLEIDIPGGEFFDGEQYKFVKVQPTKLRLEHSLISISKWESRTHKPFIGSSKTKAEILDYISDMCVGSFDPKVIAALTQNDINRISDYIEDPATATTIVDHTRGKNPSREVVTAEVIYYWMIALQIPFECQKWHINRLLTLIRVCEVKSGSSKKMSKTDLSRYYRDLNAQRRSALGTKG